jgi:hypothetical protein
MAKQRSRKSTGSARARSAATRPAARSSKTGRTRGEKSAPRTGAAKSARSRTPKPAARTRTPRSAETSRHRRRAAGPEVHSGKPEIGTGERAEHERSAVMITDHDEIRRWADDRGGHPACVRGTGRGEDGGMIRIDFPGYSGEQSLQPIDWDEWFEKFEESDLGLLVLPERPELPGGKKSRFNKLISRETYRHHEEGE